jgi:hypothetical protein
MPDLSNQAHTHATPTCRRLFNFLVYYLSTVSQETGGRGGTKVLNGQ